MKTELHRNEAALSVHAKDGAAHLRSLQDARTILLDGVRVESYTEHAAYRNAIRSACQLYDLQAHNPQELTFASPASGRRVGLAWLLPTTREELRAKRAAIERWASCNCGMLGRSPDHVANALAGMVIGVDAFRKHRGGNAQALLGYFQHARDNDLALSYVIVNPQANRAKAAGDQAEDLVARVVSQSADAITISGAKMLGTGTVLSNELLIGNIAPLKPGEEAYAFSAAVPLASPGLTILSRRSYEQAAPNAFDYPLSSRFDENDALVVFDEVRIPRDRVFVLGDVELAKAQFHETGAQAYMGYQSIARLVVKLRFLIGLARRVVETNGLGTVPDMQMRLGHLAAQVGMVEGLLDAMEVNAVRVGDHLVPAKRFVHAAQVLTQELYPLFVNVIRDMCGGGVIMLPSSAADLRSAATRDLVERTQRSVTSNAQDRVKLMRLVWDAIGSEFGSRHTQYEMFYSGSAMVTRFNAYRSFDWAAADSLVSGFLSTYNLDDARQS